MISKRIDCDPANDNYGRLARYIAAGHDRQDNEGKTLEEKCLMHWCAGCAAGDDYALAMKEVAATQALDTRTKKEKTYHLIVSFRPEDADKLTPEVLKEIEARFADALGLSERQRHCGVHINTENIHMHIAYNLIHPDRYTRTEPFNDYYKRDKLCRQLEQEYGLTVDNGKQKNQDRSQSSRAAAMEAHTGQQSFEGYCKEQAPLLKEGLAKAQTWRVVHSLFAKHGLELRPKGAGLIVKEYGGEHTAKASTLGRDFSLKKPTARFGKFTISIGVEKPHSIYKAKPLQHSPERGELWASYQANRQEKKNALAVSRQKWEKYRAELQTQTMSKALRRRMLKKARTNETIERRAIYAKYPKNWMDYLRCQAQLGNAQALDVLRSRQQPYMPDMLEQAQRQQIATMGAAATGKPVGQVLMESLVPEVKTKITRNGVLVFTLPDGGKICDSGRQITFSDTAKEKATEYMAAKWLVKKQEWGINRGSLMLPDGQLLADSGKNMFVRSVVMGRERSKGLAR